MRTQAMPANYGGINGGVSSVLDHLPPRSHLRCHWMRYVAAPAATGWRPCDCGEWPARKSAGERRERRPDISSSDTTIQPGRPPSEAGSPGQL